MAVTEYVIDRERLADWDEARDYDAASSYNYLNAELWRLRATVAEGTPARIEVEAGPVVLRSVSELLAWVRVRYPYASLVALPSDETV